MEKAPDAFRTISEVAEEIDVPQHVLRFWESRFAQIRPLKRGGGRRYYRPNDVDLLRGVRHLLYGEGYTIRGVQRLLREQGQSFVQGVWRAGAETLAARTRTSNGGNDIEDQADVSSGDGTLSRRERTRAVRQSARPNERREPKLMSPMGSRTGAATDWPPNNGANFRPRLTNSSPAAVCSTPHCRKRPSAQD